MMLFRFAIVGLLVAMFMVQLGHLSLHARERAHAHAAQQTMPLPVPFILPVRELASRSRPASSRITELTRDTVLVDIESATAYRLLADTAPAPHTRIVPRVVDGREYGFYIVAIPPGGLLAALGLRNGDTLLAVNGKRVTVTEHVLRMPRMSKCGQPEVNDLSLVRAGQPLRVVVVFHDTRDCALGG